MRRRTYFFISFLTLGFLVPFCVLADSSNISSLVFTTEPQTVDAGVLSQEMTVQTQDISGNPIPAGETSTTTLTSTSPTGQFFGPSGTSAFSQTTSATTENRNFTYKDSNPGTYTITATLIGRTSGKQFSATQTIVVTGSSADNSSSDNSDASSTNNSSADLNTTSNNSEENSSDAYSSQETIYAGSDDESFGLSIGRNRLVSVGEPVVFLARIISGDSSYAGTLFHFAFGDGTEWNGESATHTYKYPGDYIVVVEANRFGVDAVAEAKVKVVSPDVVISNSDANSVVVTNNGADEINLGGWVITDFVGRFIVPQDTIILAHSSITVSSSVMKTKTFSGVISLYDPSEKEVAAAPTDAAAGGDMTIALPGGMTAAEFSDTFSQKFSDALKDSETSVEGNGVKETKVVARPAGGQAAPLPANAEAAVAASSSPEVAVNESSSSAATVIYSVPHHSEDSVFSGIGSWFSGLFGKK